MKAQGGPIKPDRRIGIRGEKGCELFLPAGSGHVIPRVVFNAPDLGALLDKIKLREDDAS